MGASLRRRVFFLAGGLLTLLLIVHAPRGVASKPSPLLESERAAAATTATSPSSTLRAATDSSASDRHEPVENLRDSQSLDSRQERGPVEAAQRAEGVPQKGSTRSSTTPSSSTSGSSPASKPLMFSKPQLGVEEVTTFFFGASSSNPLNEIQDFHDDDLAAAKRELVWFTRAMLFEAADSECPEPESNPCRARVAEGTTIGEEVLATGAMGNMEDDKAGKAARYAAEEEREQHRRRLRLADSQRRACARELKNVHHFGDGRGVAGFGETENWLRSCVGCDPARCHSVHSC